ncbi:hypothetical protein HLB44_15890 [Aquincola sp. S2]|uniref:Sel1 repeat family protein n=1 Tax=Pseudaquabacterium terrae TaxID=2732868 RepID=A0ABX2EIT3_9BURK|nr:hypothetical protein [Aquabacterium terrae]NRF68476.1 hypothetical protein [Aquabacterium terrae]
MERLNGKMEKAGNKLVTGTSKAPTSALPADPLVSDAACAAAIDACFALAAPHTPSLGQQLLAEFNGIAQRPDQARQAAWHVALGLRAGVGTDLQRAHVAWEAIKADAVTGPLHRQRDANNALRALASCDLSYDMLWAMKDHRGHAAAQNGCYEEYKFALQATDQLMKMGVGPPADSALGIADFTAYAGQRRVQRAPRLGSTEAADVLACRTLLSACADLDGSPRSAPRASPGTWPGATASAKADPAPTSMLP